VTILILAMVGLVLLSISLAALFYVQRVSRHGIRTANWKRARRIAAAAGIALAAASMFFTYPLQDPEGAPAAGVMGIPFLMGYVDHVGQRDYGSLSAPGIVLNLAFWCLLPQIALAVVARCNRARPARLDDRGPHG
jgi:hypothetical protein